MKAQSERSLDGAVLILGIPASRDEQHYKTVQAARLRARQHIQESRHAVSLIKPCTVSVKDLALITRYIPVKIERIEQESSSLVEKC